jgi:hypothetical protein
VYVLKIFGTAGEIPADNGEFLPGCRQPAEYRSLSEHRRKPAHHVNAANNLSK